MNYHMIWYWVHFKQKTLELRHIAVHIRVLPYILIGSQQLAFSVFVHEYNFHLSEKFTEGKTTNLPFGCLHFPPRSRSGCEECDGVVSLLMWISKLYYVKVLFQFKTPSFELRHISIKTFRFFNLYLGILQCRLLYWNNLHCLWRWCLFRHLWYL